MNKLSLILYIAGFVLSVYPVARYMAHELTFMGGGTPDGSDWAFGGFVAVLGGLLWPLVAAGGVVFLLSRALWTVTVGRDDEQADRERIK